ncbi:MAG: GGDEF domain-containing protein [Bacteriovoracaceae bacterium]|nr:GGDEF domain-containing protein [Bacteriovoracaceae bacterium]
MTPQNKNEDSTILIQDIEGALTSSEKEARNKNAGLLVMGGELNGTIFDLPAGITTLGRGTDNNITLEFKGISRKHMKISMQNNQAILEDCESRNGTFLNNLKLESPTLLKKSDIIKIGSLAFKYIPAGDPERLTYERLRHEANSDGLTQCFNKTFFNSALEVEVKKCKATGLPLSLILLDLDHFKSLNDTHGHDAGDFALKELANLIRSSGLRETDIFARYGGEEFVILLPKTNLKQSFEIAERLRNIVEKHPFIYDGQTLKVTCSLGIADYRKGVDNGTDLFKRADQAVYLSKNNGRNQVTFYKDP